MSEEHGLDSSQTVTKQIVSFLKKQHVSYTFGVSGANIEHLFHELAADRDINITLARHESMAGMMAIGSVKAGQTVGVVLTTSGGASFNVVPALAEAYAQTIPIIAIIGQPSTELESSGPFQLSNGEQDTPNLEQTLSGVTRWCERAKQADEIPELLTQALKTARGVSGTPGPAALLIPRNLFEQSVTWNPQQISIPEASPCAIPQQLKLPITIILGPLVTTQYAEQEVLELAEHLQALVITSGDARGTFPNNHKLFAGVVGSMGHNSAAKAVENASTILVIGSKLPQITQYGIADTLVHKKIFSIGFDELFGIKEFTFLGKDIRSSCCELKVLPKTTTHQKPVPIRNLLNENNQYLRYAKTFQNHLLSGDNIFIDAGNCGAAMVHYLNAPPGSLWDISLSMGGMGYSFGASIGATFANKKRSWVFSGDGSFFMHGLEIHTAIEHNLPIIYVIFDNGSHGMCDLREKNFNEPQSFNRFKTELHGEYLERLLSPLTSYHVNSPEELKTILENSDLAEPLFITVNIPADEPIPFRPLLKEIQ